MQLNLEAKVYRFKSWTRNHWKRSVSRINTENCRKLSSESVEFHSWNFWLSKKCSNGSIISIFISLFSLMNFVKSNYKSNLNEEAGAACVALKITKYKPDIKYLSSLVQQQKSLIIKICLFAFPWFFSLLSLKRKVRLMRWPVFLSGCLSVCLTVCVPPPPPHQ
jgi:hypothetical protein